MKTFVKEYGKFVVTFKNENDYVEMGSGYSRPKFEGLLIREKFSEKKVEFFKDDIVFFLSELEKIPPHDKYNSTENKTPLLKLVHKYGWRGCSSDFCIVIATYDGIYCKFFMDISHQMVFDNFDILKSYSPEFPINIIIQIFKDALKEK